ncbi:MAG: hypothetical protein RI963_446 [Planctomycetota bacterium]|jgi:hypothetical protein
MAEHTHHHPKPTDDPSFHLPGALAGLAKPLAVAGGAMLLAGFFGGSLMIQGESSQRWGFTMSAYLVALIYCFSISLGCLFFVLIQHLCRAGWSVVVRRIAEIFMIAIPALGLLFLPIVLAAWSPSGVLYPWSNAGWGESHGVPAETWESKIRYLNSGWFTVRSLIYLVLLSLLAIFYFRSSRSQDESGDVGLTEKMQARSGPAVIIFALVTSFAAFDWLMSLAPMWFSTMFGVYFFAGSILSAHAAIAATTYLLQSKGAIRDEVTVEHYHDLGKLMFGFVTFWTYIAFSQFVLIWYANIPEETEWFYTRLKGSWEPLSYALIFFHWLFPFLGLLSRHIRRRPQLVFAWAIYLLVIHFVEIYWIVMPQSSLTFGGAGGVVTSLLMGLGMVGLYLGGLLWFTSCKQVKVLAVRDPRLPESLAFENI